MSLYRNRTENLRRAYTTEKTIANALGINRVSSTPILSDGDIYIEPQQSYKIIDQAERGELIYAEVATNSPLMIAELILYDERLQPITVINNKTFLELLQLGRGMTPGRVQAAATGQTQDEEGFFIDNMFHIARYKDDTLSDWTGNAGSITASERWFVGRFVATIPFPYNTITFYIKNTTTDSNKRVFSYSLARTVYEIGSQSELIEKPEPAAVELAGISQEDDEQIAITTPAEETGPNLTYDETGPL